MTHATTTVEEKKEWNDAEHRGLQEDRSFWKKTDEKLKQAEKKHS